MRKPLFKPNQLFEAVEMFKNGESFNDIAKTLKIHPSDAEEIVRLFMRAQSSERVEVI